jgi:hypothetical protein
MSSTTTDTQMRPQISKGNANKKRNQQMTELEKELFFVTLDPQQKDPSLTCSMKFPSWEEGWVTINPQGSPERQLADSVRFRRIRGPGQSLESLGFIDLNELSFEERLRCEGCNPPVLIYPSTKGGTMPMCARCKNTISGISFASKSDEPSARKASCSREDCIYCDFGVDASDFRIMGYRKHFDRASLGTDDLAIGSRSSAAQSSPTFPSLRCFDLVKGNLPCKMLKGTAISAGVDDADTLESIDSEGQRGIGYRGGYRGGLGYGGLFLGYPLAYPYYGYGYGYGYPYGYGYGYPYGYGYGSPYNYGYPSSGVPPPYVPPPPSPPAPTASRVVPVARSTASSANISGKQCTSNFGTDCDACNEFEHLRIQETVFEDNESSLPIGGRKKQPKRPIASTENHGVKVLGLQKAMRTAWQEHGSWTREALICLDNGLSSVTAVVERLMKNQVDIGNIFGAYYGSEIGFAVTALLKEHITLTVEVAGLEREKMRGHSPSSLATESEKWRRNGKDIAVALNKLNPTSWGLENLEKAMEEHLNGTLEEALKEFSKDYSASISLYDKVLQHLLHMADLLSEGIQSQFFSSSTAPTSSLVGSKFVGKPKVPRSNRKHDIAQRGGPKKVTEIYLEKPMRLGSKKHSKILEQPRAQTIGGKDFCATGRVRDLLAKKKEEEEEEEKVMLGWYLDPFKRLPWSDYDNLWWYSGENLRKYRPALGTETLLFPSAANSGIPKIQLPAVRFVETGETPKLYSETSPAIVSQRRCCATDGCSKIRCVYVCHDKDKCPHCGVGHYCSAAHAGFVADEAFRQKGLEPIGAQSPAKNPSLDSSSSLCYYCPEIDQLWLTNASANLTSTQQQQQQQQQQNSGTSTPPIKSRK